LRHRAGNLVGGGIVDEGVAEDEGRHSLWVGGGEKHRNGRAFTAREQHRTLGPDGVHDDEEVVGERLEWRHVVRREPLGASPTTFVREDQPAVTREPSQEPREVRALPSEVDVRRPALVIQEIHGPFSDHLIRKRHVSVPGVRLWCLHADILAPPK
jgi:hypothetical protein